MLLFAINTSTSRIISERRGKDRDRLIKICCMCRAEPTAIQCAACCRCVGQSEIGALGDAAVVTATRSNEEKFGDVSFLSNRVFPSFMATYTYRHPPTPAGSPSQLLLWGLNLSWRAWAEWAVVYGSCLRSFLSVLLTMFWLLWSGLCLVLLHRAAQPDMEENLNKTLV